MRNLDSLRKAVMEAEATGWVQYKGEYFKLIDERGFNAKAASYFIANHLNLSNEDSKRLYNSSKSWRRRRY